jgi:hypothetical protein
MLTLEVLRKGIFPLDNISTCTSVRAQGSLIWPIMTNNNIPTGIDIDIGVGDQMVEIGVASAVP